MTRSYRDHRLPPGRHRLSREEVAANQRWRLIAATGEVIAERGVIGTTSRAIADRAGVSSSTFYARFDGVDAALAASFAAAASSLRDVVAVACSEEAEPATRIGAAVSAALAFLTEPALAARLSLQLAIAVPALASENEALLRSAAEQLTVVQGVADTEPAARFARHLVAGALARSAEQLSGADGEGIDALASELARLLIGDRGR